MSVRGISPFAPMHNGPGTAPGLFPDPFIVPRQGNHESLPISFWIIFSLRNPLRDKVSPKAWMITLIPRPRALGDLSKVRAITYRLVPREGVTDLAIPSTDNQVVQKHPDGSLSLTVKPVRKASG